MSTRPSAAHLLLGHADEAIEFARRGCAGNPRLYFPHLFLAAALGLKGDIDGARTALAEAIKVRPEFSSFARLQAYIRPGTAQHRALYESTIKLGLRRAGMPDE